MSIAHLTRPPVALPTDDPFVLHGCRLRQGFVLEETSRYSDDVWHLHPIQHREHETTRLLNFLSLPSRFRPAAKQLFYQLLSGPLPDGELRPAVISVRGCFSSIKRFLVWLDQRWPAGRAHLSELTGRDLDDYRKHLLIALPDSSGRRATHRAHLRMLWRWRSGLGVEGLPFDPRHLDGWGEKKRKDRENTTPRLPESVLGPLLGWALRFIDDFADDILRADQQWWQMRSARKAGPYKTGELGIALRGLLDEYVSAGRPLPGHNGRPNMHLLGRFLQLPGRNTSTPLRRYRADVDAVADQVGLTSTSQFRTPIRGLVGSRPWLTGIETHHTARHSLAGLARNLQAAAYTVIAFLSGI